MEIKSSLTVKQIINYLKEFEWLNNIYSIHVKDISTEFTSPSKKDFLEFKIELTQPQSRYPEDMRLYLERTISFNTNGLVDYDFNIIPFPPYCTKRNDIYTPSMFGIEKISIKKDMIILEYDSRKELIK